jgi:hypothetical protein
VDRHIEFTELSRVEANRWLAAHGQPGRVERPTTLAELFGGAGDDGPGSGDRPSRSFGFARALDATPRLS